MKCHEHICLQSYALAYIDILNQKSKLRELNKIPNGKQIDEVHLKKIADTYGRVYQLREDAEKFFTSISNRPCPSKEEYIEKFGTSKKYDEYCQYLKNTNVAITTQMFSDSIVVYTPLENSEGKPMLSGLFQLLSSCAQTFLLSTSRKSIVRGGIEVGIGAELSNMDFYGPVLGKAYFLESKVAQYPRIVIGNELMSNLKKWETINPSDELESVNHTLANLSSQWITVDGDGRLILDYLGLGLKYIADNYPSLNLNELVPSNIIPEIITCLNEQMTSIENQQDTKLGLRYLAFQNYIESRLALWELEPKSTS